MYDDFISELEKKACITQHPKNNNSNGPYFHLHVVSRQPRYTILQANKPEIIEAVSEQTRTNTAHVHIIKNKLEQGYFVTYPRNTSHSELFSQSTTCFGGPNFLFPGSIAILKYSTIKCLDEFHFHYLQFSFKQGHPKQITRNVASKYQGARKRLFQTALSHMNDNGLVRIVRGYQMQQSHKNNQILNELLLEKEFSHITERK